MPKDILARLKDIHLPQGVGWWPLAPGWYGLLILMLLLIVIGSRSLKKKRQDAAAKTAALSLLASYEQDYREHHNASIASAQIAELLKRVALVYYPREQVASMHGDDWLNFLAKNSKNIDFTGIDMLLLAIPFRPNQSIDLSPLFHCARRWIQQRGKPCSS